MNIDPRIISDTEFLAELLVDSGMINGDTRTCTTDVGKRAIEIYQQFEDNPRKITFGQIQDLTLEKGSQIGMKGPYLSHVQNTGGVFRSLVLLLGKIHPDLDLPHPDVAYAAGLIHDLNATFSDYAKGGQQSKEFDEYLLAKRCGWENVASQVAMHSDYLGGVRLMAEGADFPKKEAYTDMIAMLQGDGPLSYEAIFKEFEAYMHGTDRLHLLLLTVSDYMEMGKPFFNQDSFDPDFEARSQDIMWRYHGKAVSEAKTPSLLGQALVDGGLERVGLYKGIVSTLINNDKVKIEQLRETTNFFK
jgi:hypothetical protein